MRGVLILSGGVDSTTLLYKMLSDGYEVAALTFNYAQRHKKEIASALLGDHFSDMPDYSF